MTTPTPVGRRARRQQHGRRNTPGLLLAVAALLGLALVVDVLVPESGAPAAAPVQQEPATAGVWYCPVVAEEGGSAALHVAAVGDEPAQVVVERYAGGSAKSDKARSIPPGGEVVVKLAGADAAAPVAVRWTGGPTAATWRMNGPDDRGGAAPCEPQPSPYWYIPGFTTTLGTKSFVHVFNPYTSDAVVRLLFALPDGPETLVLADNILVGAGTTKRIDMRDFKPEQADLGVIVQTLAGRVVAQGEMNVTPPPRTSGSSGRVLLQGAPEPSEQWAVASASHGESVESWLSVLNPGEKEAAVEVRVSDPAGGGSSLLGEVNIPAGGLSRIELAKASEATDFGVSVNVVNSEPVVVSRLVTRPYGGEQVLLGGIAAAAPSTTWALLGSGSRGNAGVVSIYNPGPEPTLVDVTGPGAPTGWAGIKVGPNARVTVDLATATKPADSLPVVVQAQAPVVVNLRSANASNPFSTWLLRGTPAADWIGATSRPPVARDPKLETHHGEASEPADDPLSGFQGVESATEPSE